VVRQYGIVAQPFGEIVSYTLGQPAGIDEHQRGAVCLDQLRHAIVNFAPHLVGGDRPEFIAGHFHRKLHLAAMSDVDNLRAVAQEGGDVFERFHCGRKTDPLGLRSTVLFHQVVEAGEREREVRAALVIGHRVDLVDDEGAHFGQHFARLGGREQDEQ